MDNEPDDDRLWVLYDDDRLWVLYGHYADTAIALLGIPPLSFTEWLAEERRLAGEQDELF